MSRSARKVAAIAHNTFREAVRNKILHSLLFFAVALILFAVALGELTLGEDIRMIRDVGLFGVDLFGVLIAIFLGVNLLYKELQLKTVYTILPKPIHRWQFVLGKWLGMIITLALQMLVMGLVLYATLLVNGAPLESATAKAIWLLFANVVLVTSVAVFFSSFSSPFLSGLFALGVFVVGRSIPDMIELGKKTGGTMGAAVGGIAKVLPNLHLFYPSGAIVGAKHVTVHEELVGLSYLGWTTLYSVAYSAVALGLAMLIFRRRDFV
jgi:ABC-type transport system involved in multi-copper enzyme maturation permease subunit